MMYGSIKQAEYYFTYLNNDPGNLNWGDEELISQ